MAGEPMAASMVELAQALRRRSLSPLELARSYLAEIEARGPQVVALSGHDSTPWTYGAFTRRFGARYRTLRAGEELRISAAP